MTTFKSHCSVDYHQFGPTELDTKAHAVSEGIYNNNPPFTAPPVATKAAFDAVIITHHDTYEAYKNGGADQKGAYLTARTALITQMDDTGHYVDGIAGVNDDMITLAGFTPTKTGESNAVVPSAPADIKITRGITGELFAECAAVPGAIYYGCLMLAGVKVPEGFGISNAGQVLILKDIAGGGPTAPMAAGKDITGTIIGIDLTKGRKKHFTGLTKGVDYNFYFYAANSAGVSQLSEAVSLMCG